jgi:hypothetical protein
MTVRIEVNIKSDSTADNEETISTSVRMTLSDSKNLSIGFRVRLSDDTLFCFRKLTLVFNKTQPHHIILPC